MSTVTSLELPSDSLPTTFHLLLRLEWWAQTGVLRSPEDKQAFQAHLATTYTQLGNAHASTYASDRRVLHQRCLPHVLHVLRCPDAADMATWDLRPEELPTLLLCLKGCFQGTGELTSLPPREDGAGLVAGMDLLAVLLTRNDKPEVKLAVLETLRVMLSVPDLVLQVEGESRASLILTAAGVELVVGGT